MTLGIWQLAMFASKNRQVVQIRIRVSHVGAVVYTGSLLQYMWFPIHLYTGQLPNSSGQLAELTVHIIPLEQICIVVTRSYWIELQFQFWNWIEPNRAAAEADVCLILNIIAADALAPFVTWSSAVMILSVDFYEEGINSPVSQLFFSLAVSLRTTYISL